MKKTFMLHGGRAMIGGLVTSVLATAALISIIATLILSGSLPESAVEFGVGICLFLSSFSGALLAARGEETRIAIRVAVLGLAYILTLFLTGIIVLDGTVSYLIRNILCILFGCVAACAICIRKRKSKPRRKNRVR